MYNKILCTGQKSVQAVMLSLFVAIVSLKPCEKAVMLSRKSDTIAKKAIASRNKFKINML